MKRKFVNYTTQDHAGEGQDIKEMVAAFEYITNSVDAAVSAHLKTSTRALVWANIVNGSDYSVTEDGVRYFLCADNGQGIKDFSRLFTNGNPQEYNNASNHKYNKGVIRAWSRFCPQNNHVAAFLTRNKNGWTCYSGTYGDIYHEELTDEQFVFDEYNTVVFIPIDETIEANANIDNVFVDFLEEASVKYYFKLMANQNLSIMWGDDKQVVQLPRFYEDAIDDKSANYEDDYSYWGFKLHIIKKVCAAKEAGKGKGAQLSVGMLSGGGICVADNGLMIQDYAFSIIPKRSKMKKYNEEFLALEADIQEKLSKRRIKLVDAVKAKADFLQNNEDAFDKWRGLQRFDGVDKAQGGVLQRYRYLIDVIPTNEEFRLETTSTKTEFKNTPAFMHVIMAINASIGFDVRLIHARQTEASNRAKNDRNIRDILHMMGEREILQTEVAYSDSEDNRTALRADARIVDSVTKDTLTVIEYKLNKITGVNVMQAQGYHMREIAITLDKHPNFVCQDKNRVVKVPNLSIYTNAKDITPEAIKMLEIYHDMARDTIKANCLPGDDWTQHDFNIYLIGYDNEKSCDPDEVKSNIFMSL